MPDVLTSLTANVPVRGYRRPDGGFDQYVIPGSDRVVTFDGRAATFRAPGRGTTTGQTLLTLFNTSGSGVIVAVRSMTCDLVQTVVKAVTVAPPTVRLHRLTAAASSGATLPKVAMDSAQTSPSGVVLLQDASADNTSATAALTATIAAGTMMTQEIAPRLITAAGYEPADRMEFLSDQTDLLLREGQGVALFLSHTAATQNPTTDVWTSNIRWQEFTRP